MKILMPEDLDQAMEEMVKEHERRRRLTNRLIIAALALFIVASIVAAALAQTPDWRTFNPAVTQDTIASTICVKGYTATVRPPYYITSLIKRRLLEAQGMTWDRARDFELDHIVPLTLGGEPGDLDHTSNFMLQPWPEARRKDRVEVVSGQCVCNNQVTLAEARADMEDWRAAYSKYARMVCRRPR